MLCANGELDASMPDSVGAVPAGRLRTLVGGRLYRTPTWLDFPDLAMAPLPLAHPTGRHMLYLD